MFKSIVVGVDSSEHSRHAQTLAFYRWSATKTVGKRSGSSRGGPASKDG